jgi:hypothetical protein
MGYVGQLIPFCLGVGGLVKVVFAFFDQNAAHGWRLRECRCDDDEEMRELARLWREVKELEKALKGEKEEEIICKARRSGLQGWTYWMRVSTLRFRGV